MNAKQSFMEVLNITSSYLDQGYEDDGIFELFKFAFLACRGPKSFLTKFGKNNSYLNLNLIQDGIFSLRNEIRRDLCLNNEERQRIQFHNTQVSKLI